MPPIRTAILISGRGSNMRAIISAASAPGYPAHVALVISSRPDAEGLEHARNANIQTVVIPQTAFSRDDGGRTAYDSELHRTLVHYRIEFVCLAGFMRILSPGFVSKWRNRIINIHPSLLPQFKGLKPQAQALAAGVAVTGCTVHFVEPELDAGPIIAQQTVPIEPGDTEQNLTDRILRAEHRLYPEALKMALLSLPMS